MGYIGSGPTRFNTADELTVTGDAEFNGNATFGDNDKIVFGAGSDLEIYHSGSTSVINENGTGNLALNTNGANIQLTKGFAENLATFNADGAVTLFYDNAPKLDTTSTGVDVTGTVTADGLTVANDGALIWGTGVGRPAIIGNENTDDMDFYIQGNKAINISGGGDISFYEDTGTTAKFFWDASAEALGIGTTSPSVNTEIRGSASNGQLRLGGSTTATYANIYSDNDGVLVLGADAGNNAANSYFGIEVDGSERLRIDDSGNVGIGRSNPQGLLDVGVSGATSNQFLTGGVGNNAVTGIFKIGSGVGRGASIQGFRGASSNLHSLDFYTYNSADVFAMRIDTSGNVGIGTSSPVASSLLTLKETSAGGDGAELRLINSSTTVESATQIVFTNTTTDTANSAVIKAVRTASGQDFRFSSDGTERLRIDSSGNVGIGTQLPNAKLEVKGSTRLGNRITSATDYSTELSGFGVISGAQRYGSYGMLNFYATSGYTSSARTFAITNAYGANKFAILYGNDSTTVPSIGSGGGVVDGGLALAIDGSGKVDIGRLYVEADASLVDPMTVSNTNTTANSQYAIVFVRNGVIRGSIQTTNTATSYNTSSDYRLKTAVNYDWDATTRLKQLRPARFEWIADGDDAVPVDGFLAHEVQDIVPEAITGTKDAMRDEEYEVTPAVLDEDGNEVTPAVMGTRSVPDYQGIDQSKLVPLLVKTIQELEARIAALETA